MNICIATRSTTHHSSSGGMETHTKQLAEGLVSIGHKVSVVSTAHPEERERLVQNGVLYYFLKGTESDKYSGLYWRESAEFIKGLNDVERLDIILGESAGAAGYVLSRYKSVPVIEIAHGSLRSEVLTILDKSGSIKEYANFIAGVLPYTLKTYLTLDLRSAHKEDAIIAVSGKIAQEIQSDLFLPSSKVHVVYNGIDVGKFKTQGSEPKAELRLRLGMEDNDRVLLYLGRVVKEKGLQDVIAILPGLIEGESRMKLLIVGEGDYKDNLKAQMSKLKLDEGYVRFVGEVPYEETPNYYNVADVFVFPTHRREGFPMTLIEAQACGLPVVAADKGGSIESIDYGKTGYSYDSGDLEQLKHLLLKLLSDDEERREMGRTARARAEQLFSQEVMVDKTLEVIEQVRSKS